MKLKTEEFAQVNGDTLGEQHESHKELIWTVTGTEEREVPPGSKVHQSVKDRIDGSEYQPVASLPEDVEWVG